ncbi:MAG: NUDIX hydrolase [Rickettsiales bacterium]|nr:NUDIX hydrolase [Rickettsiales bacterium]
MLDFLERCEDCFDRSCRVGHFTASSWLVSKDLSKVLLMHHKKLNFWVQLGGHCDGDSNVMRVAVKEACEESGIKDITPLRDDIFDIDMHLIPQIKQDQPHYHFDIRFLLKTNHDNLVMNDEANSLRWFAPDKENLPTSSPSILRMLNKWRQYKERFLKISLQ